MSNPVSWGKTTSLVLAGGGARGVCAAGMAKAYFEMGFTYDNLYGASVGALNGMLIHQNDMVALESLWTNIQTSQVYNSNPLTWAGASTPTASFFDPSPLRALITKNLNYQKLVSNPKNFTIAATSLNTWESITLNVKDLTEPEVIDFLMASSAAPIAFPSVKFMVSYLVDVGTVLNFYLSGAIADNSDTIVIMTATVPEQQLVKNVTDVLAIMLGLPERDYLPRELWYIEKLNTLVCYPKTKIILIAPPKPTGISLLDFSYNGMDRKALMQYGYDLAKAALEKACS